MTIKKFAEEKYKLEVTGVNLSQLNRAIASGVESGLFTLPKGPSGKVKLAPKAKASTSGSKEVYDFVFRCILIPMHLNLEFEATVEEQGSCCNEDWCGEEACCEEQRKEDDNNHCAEEDIGWQGKSDDDDKENDCGIQEGHGQEGKRYVVTAGWGTDLY